MNLNVPPVMWWWASMGPIGNCPRCLCAGRQRMPKAVRLNAQTQLTCFCDHPQRNVWVVEIVGPAHVLAGPRVEGKAQPREIRLRVLATPLPMTKDALVAVPDVADHADEVLFEYVHVHWTKRPEARSILCPMLVRHELDAGGRSHSTRR